MSEIAIIIVNWNGKKFLEDCLKSLENQTNKNFRIILVDNGSMDDSVFFVKNNYPEIEIIELSQNTGFAKGNNIGIKKALEDGNIKYVLVLNNDTKVPVNFVEIMLSCAKRYRGFGSIQPKILNYDGTKIDSAGILICREMSAQNRGYGEEGGRYSQEAEIFGSSACAAIYTREALEKTQLPNNNYFDEDYFAYYEDVDLAWRLRLAGYRSFYCPHAAVVHFQSATGVKYSPFKKFHIHRNQYYNIIKNLPFGMVMRALFFMPVRYGMLLNSIRKQRGSSAELVKRNHVKPIKLIGLVLKIWLEVLKNLPGLLRKRKYIRKIKSVGNREIERWFQSYKADLKKIIYG
jgi:GT2 family glycosyltransferase